MADYKKIDDFSEASAFEDTDKLLVSKAKVTYTILGSKIKAFCQAAISTLVAQVNSDATAAANAKTAAQTAQTNAETANTNAQDAKTAALSAKTDAETAASTATAAAAAMQECAAYSSTKAYAVGNMATYNGSTYRCTTACTGVVPTNTANWLLIAAAGKDGTGTGDMLASIYDPDNEKKPLATEEGLSLHTSNTDIHVTAADKSTWDGKQNALTFDSTPTAGSTNPVTSGGVKTALDAKANATDLTAHVNDKANPHAVTKSQVGLGSVDNASVYTLLNRSTAVNVADTNYTTLMARGIGLVSADTTPTVNGAINFTYG